MVVFVFFIIIFVLSFIMQSYLDLLAIAGIKPDLLLLFTIYFAFKEEEFRGAWIGFVSGLVQDALSVTPLGWHALPKGILGYLIGRYGKSLRGESLFSLGLMIFIISIIQGVMLLILALFFLDVRIAMLYKVILPEALYNAIIGPMLFTIYDRIFGFDMVGGTSV